KIRRFPNGGSDLGDTLNWGNTSITVLEGIYGTEDKHVQQLVNLKPPSSTGDDSLDATNGLILARQLLSSYLDEIIIFLDTPEFQESIKNPPDVIDKSNYLEQIFNKFHLIATRLQNRGKNKEPFLINDESDVQDLLRALITPLFDDIRIEEPTPSFGGNFSKMDFTIKGEKIVIETKIASSSHPGNKIVDELLTDIPRYKKSKDCRLLICFIYDPDFSLREPSAIKIDLEKQSTDKFGVEVVIEPKR